MYDVSYKCLELKHSISNFQIFTNNLAEIDNLDTKTFGWYLY